MKFWRDIVKWLRNYSAARWSGERSRLHTTLQDARLDLSRATRQELVRKSRYWQCESGLYQKLCDLWEQYVSGPDGLSIVSASSSDEWNIAADREFAAWSRFPDIQSLQPFSVLTSLVARTWFVDGECFVMKVTGDSGRPRLQIIESHHVYTPGSESKREGVGVIDGVEVDGNGRPIGYWIETQSGWMLVPADRMLHVFEPHRPCQYRGIPMVSSVLNDLHDLEDLQRFEMIAAKDSATISNVIQKKSGELTRTGLTRSRFAIGQTSATGSTVNENVVEYVASRLPGRTVGLPEGDTIQQFQSTRPSIASQQYWDYITSKICAGVGISKLLVFPTSMQGTVVRADLDTQDAFFRSRSSVLQSFAVAVREYVVTAALRFQPALRDLPGDWQSVSVQAPRSVKVDVGYNSQAAIAEIQNGLGTRQEFFGQRGRNWRRELRQSAIEVAELKRLADEFGVSPREIDQNLSDNAQSANQQPIESI